MKNTLMNSKKLEVIFKPTDSEISRMAETALKLMNIKMNDWILHQLTAEQLETCIEQFKKEVEKRSK